MPFLSYQPGYKEEGVRHLTGSLARPSPGLPQANLRPGWYQAKHSSSRLGSLRLPCILCHHWEKSPWREAALCWEAISLSGQGKKWGISSLVCAADFSSGGSSFFLKSSKLV